MGNKKILCVYRFVGGNMKNKKIIISLILMLIFLSFINLRIIISNLYRTGVNYFESKGNYQKVETLLKQNLYMQNILSKNHPNFLINAVDNIINFYNEQGLYNESERVYEKYLDYKIAYSNKSTMYFYDNSKLNLAKVYSDLGTIKLKLGKYKESENYYKKALNIRENSPDKSSIYIDNKLYSVDVELWIELNNLGFLKIQEKKYNEAKAYFDEALQKDQYKMISNPWQIYYNLSILYRELGDYKLAERYAQKLLINSPPQSEVGPIPYSPKHKVYLIKLISKFDSLFKKNLAEIYIKQKKYKEAESLTKNVLWIDMALYNSKAPDILCDHYKLYNIYEKMNTRDSKNLIREELKQIDALKLNILSTKKYSGDKLTSQLENICKQ